MLLSKVNRRLSVAVDHRPKKQLLPQNVQKKISNKHGASQIKFNNRNSKKKTTAVVRTTELELLPPSDSEDDWTSRNRLETYWHPLHKVDATTNSIENHSVKTQAKVEFDNISKRIAKVHQKVVAITIVVP